MQKTYCDICGNETDWIPTSCELELTVSDFDMRFFSDSDMCRDCYTRIKGAAARAISQEIDGIIERGADPYIQTK